MIAFSKTSKGSLLAAVALVAIMMCACVAVSVVEDADATSTPETAIGVDPSSGLAGLTAGTYKLSSDYTMSTDDTIPAGVTIYTDGKTITTGGFTLTVNGTLYLNEDSSSTGGTLTLTARANLAGDGTIVICEDSTVSMAGATLIGSSGAVTISSGTATITNFDPADHTDGSGFDLILGDGETAASATVNSNWGPGEETSITVSANADVTIDSSVTLTNAGTIVNEGTVTVSGTITGTGEFINYGSIVIEGGVSANTDNSKVTIVNEGTVTIGASGAKNLYVVGGTVDASLMTWTSSNNSEIPDVYNGTVIRYKSYNWVAYNVSNTNGVNVLIGVNAVYYDGRDYSGTGPVDTGVTVRMLKWASADEDDQVTEASFGFLGQSYVYAERDDAANGNDNWGTVVDANTDDNPNYWIRLSLSVATDVGSSTIPVVAYFVILPNEADFNFSMSDSWVKGGYDPETDGPTLAVTTPDLEDAEFDVTYTITDADGDESPYGEDEIEDALAALEEGTYTVSVTVDGGTNISVSINGGSNTASQTVTVTPAPVESDLTFHSMEEITDEELLEEVLGEDNAGLVGQLQENIQFIENPDAYSLLVAGIVKEIASTDDAWTALDTIFSGAGETMPSASSGHFITFYVESSYPIGNLATTDVEHYLSFDIDSGWALVDLTPEADVDEQVYQRYYILYIDALNESEDGVYQSDETYVVDVTADFDGTLNSGTGTMELYDETEYSLDFSFLNAYGVVFNDELNDSESAYVFWVDAGYVFWMPGGAGDGFLNWTTETGATFGINSMFTVLSKYDDNNDMRIDLTATYGESEVPGEPDEPAYYDVYLDEVLQGNYAEGTEIDVITSETVIGWTVNGVIYTETYTVSGADASEDGAIYLESYEVEASETPEPEEPSESEDILVFFNVDGSKVYLMANDGGYIPTGTITVTYTYTFYFEGLGLWITETDTITIEVAEDCTFFEAVVDLSGEEYYDSITYIAATFGDFQSATIVYTPVSSE